MPGFNFNYNQSRQKSQSSSTQDVWGAQKPWLERMYAGAGGLAGQQAGDMGGVNDWYGGLQGAAMPAFQNLAMGPQNPWLQGMADTAMGSVARNFNQNIMPGIQGGANMAGQRGGAREGLLTEQAGGEAMRAMGDVANNIYGGAWNSGMQGQLGALGQLGNLGNLGMGQMNAQWAPWLNMRNVIGPPTTLTQSNAISKGSSYGMGMGASMI